MVGTVNSTEIFMDILVAIPKIYCLALILFIVIRLYQNTLTVSEFKQFKSWFIKIDAMYLIASLMFFTMKPLAENFGDWMMMMLLLLFVSRLDIDVLRLYHRLPVVMVFYVMELGSLLMHYMMPTLLTGVLWLIEAGIIVFSIVGYILLVIRLHRDKGKSGS